MTASPAARAAKVAHTKRLRAIPGVTGVGVGLKETGGALTATQCVKVFVRKKRALADIPVDERIPALLDGVPTDVVEATFRAVAEFTGRYNPVIGGVSIGNLRTGGAGTMGCLVYDVATREERLLSNYHVYAVDALEQPDGVSQPGRTADGEQGDAGDFVGVIDRVLLDGVVDCGIATVSGHRIVEPAEIGLGPVSGARAPVLGDALVKSGRTTGTVSGTVDAVDVSVTVSYLFGDRDFDGVVSVRSPDMDVSLPGDSGSVWIDGTGTAVVLNFAGSEDDPKRGIGCVATEVASRLGVDFRSGMTSVAMIAVLAATA